MTTNPFPIKDTLSMMNLSLTPRRRLLSHAAWALPATAVLALTGCGGVGNTVSARLRAVDAATNAGTTNLLVNSSGSYGDQTYFNASQYFYISTGSSAFSALANTQTSTAETAATSNHNLSKDQFYTAYLVGRPDVAPGTGTDTHYLQVHVTQDNKPSIGAGQAAIRVLDAAPDAGAVDVLVNGAAPAPSFTDLTFMNPGDTFVTAPYTLVSAGTLSVTVNVTGTSTAVIPATNISVQAGKAYTILVTEPTGGTAATATTVATPSTYALQTTSE